MASVSPNLMQEYAACFRATTVVNADSVPAIAICNLRGSTGLVAYSCSYQATLIGKTSVLTTDLHRLKSAVNPDVLEAMHTGATEILLVVEAALHLTV